jgi:hypothetical protein
MATLIPLDTLRDRIAEAVAANVKAYNVPAVCVRVGIQQSVEPDDSNEAFRSRRVYVKNRLLNFNGPELLRIAGEILKEFSNAALEDVVSEMTVHAERRISEITRRDVLKSLNPLDRLFGDMPVFEGLNIVAEVPLAYEELNDSFNFLPSIAKEINQHYLCNDDYSHEEVLIRCGALTCSQGRFFALIEKLLHPVVRRDEEQNQLAATIDEILKRDGFAVIVVATQSDYPVYGVRMRNSGVPGPMKNLIFASVGDKPEIVFRDAINNDVEIVKNADKVLVYDRPLPATGTLRWIDLRTWWQEKYAVDDPNKAKTQLYRHLLDSVRKTGSPGELAIFHTYYKAFGPRLKEKLPALLPQVYVHYDPYTKRQRGDEKVLERQRMDFLLMLEHGVRVVIEVDGQQHYAVKNEIDGVYIANPSLYAAMAAEDRRLRLAGYELYRFGGGEFRDVDVGVTIPDAAVGAVSQAVVHAFFEKLLKRHKVL